MHRNNNLSNYRNDPNKNPVTGYSSDTTLNKKKLYAKTEPYLDTKKKRGIYIYTGRTRSLVQLYMATRYINLDKASRTHSTS